MTNLGELILSHNYFYGSLVNLPSNLSDPQLVYLDVSNNCFTGTIPDELFNNSVLNKFVAANNCFSGSISSCICNAYSLQLLDLSGLTSGIGCGAHAKYIALEYYVNYVVRNVPGLFLRVFLL